jgi:hypothetical protein
MFSNDAGGDGLRSFTFLFGMAEAVKCQALYEEVS